MISISADTKKLEFALARLAEAAKVDTGLVIKQEAAYVAKAVMQMTPPTGDKTKKGPTVPTVTGGEITKTKASGLSTNAKEQGEKAILGDLFGGNKMAKEFQIGLFQRIGNSTEVPPRGGQHETMGVSLGNEGGKKIRIYRKFWQGSIEMMKAFHFANRTERGRRRQVTRSLIGRWAVQDQMWVSEEAANAYLKHTQKKVGLAKAGFAAAAMACGVRVPSWIRRHMAKAGNAQVQFGANPFVVARTSGNQIPDLQRVVDGALKIRYKITISKFRAVLANRAVNLGFTRVGGAMPIKSDA